VPRPEDSVHGYVAAYATKDAPEKSARFDTAISVTLLTFMVSVTDREVVSAASLLITIL
jgi:hypothetical protein